MARIGWGRHSTVAQGEDSGDQVSVNAWNANNNQAGILGFTKQEGTISSGAILVSGSLIEVQADGTLSTLTPTDNNEFDIIYLIAKSTATAVTVTHDATGGAGKIRLLSSLNKTLSTTVPTILVCRTIGANKEWVEYGGGTTSSLDDIGDVTITSNSAGEILKWNGSAWINNTLAEANIQPIVAGVNDTEIGYLDGVTSSIQTQLDAKAPSTNAVLVTPALGTPTSGTLTNCTGTASGLTAGNVSAPYNVVGLQDIFIPAAAMWARTTSGAGGLTKVETATNKINYQVWEFDSASVEYVQFGWIPPRNYNNGTVKFTFWWTNAAGLTTETVDWNVAGVAFRNDDALEAAMGTAVTTTDTWIAQNDVHISPQSTAVTIGGTVQDSDFIMFEISRKVSTDNLTGDARLIGVTLEYTIDAATAA